MNRRIAITISLVLVFVLSVPSIPSHAYAYVISGVVTQDCVYNGNDQTFDFGLPLDSWSGGVEGSGDALSHFVKPSDCFPYTNQILNDRGIFNQLQRLSSFEINLDDYYYALGGNYGANIAQMSLFLIPKDGEYVNSSICGTYSTYNGSSTGSASNGFGFLMSASDAPSDVTSIPITMYNCSWSGGTNWSNWTQGSTQMGRRSVNNENSIFYFYFASGIGQTYNLMFSNIDFFFTSYATWLGGYRNEQNGNYIYPTVNQQVFANKHFGLIDEFPKGTTGWFNLSTDSPYYDGISIVEPAPTFDEIPENKQIAFKSIDLLQVYSRGSGAQTDARLDWTMDDNSFNFSEYPIGWRMNYMLHISGSIVESASYRVFTPTQNTLTFDVYVPYDYPVNGDFTFSEILLGHSTFQLEDALKQDGVEFYGSEGAVGGLACIAYGVATDQSFAFSAASFSADAMEGFTNAISNNPASFASNVIFDVGLFAERHLGNSKAGYAYVLQSLNYDVTARCYNPTYGLKSRLGESSVNMVTGEHTSTAPGAVVDDGTGNEITLPDYTKHGDDYLTVQYDNNGNPVYVVNNIQLPSGAGGSSSSVSSGGNAYASLTVPDRIELVEDTLKQFAELMSQPAESVQGSFWGFFGLFKDNPIADIYGDYFGFLPEGFKDYVLALCGISFGVICFSAIRHRLT